MVAELDSSGLEGTLRSKKLCEIKTKETGVMASSSADIICNNFFKKINKMGSSMDKGGQDVS